MRRACFPPRLLVSEKHAPFGRTTRHDVSCGGERRKKKESGFRWNRASLGGRCFLGSGLMAWMVSFRDPCGEASTHIQITDPSWKGISCVWLPWRPDTWANPGPKEQLPLTRRVWDRPPRQHHPWPLRTVRTGSPRQVVSGFLCLRFAVARCIGPSSMECTECSCCRRIGTRRSGNQTVSGSTFTSQFACRPRLPRFRNPRGWLMQTSTEKTQNHLERTE